MDDRKQLPVRVPLGLKRDIERVAKENRRSVTAEIQVAIETHVASHPQSEATCLASQ
jgi:hypothetical protein